MHILCFIYTFEETIPQKGASPLHIPILNYCINASGYFLNNSEILIKYIILDLYNDPLYLPHLIPLFWPYPSLT